MQHGGLTHLMGNCIFAVSILWESFVLTTAFFFFINEELSNLSVRVTLYRTEPRALFRHDATIYKKRVHHFPINVITTMIRHCRNDLTRLRDVIIITLLSQIKDKAAQTRPTHDAL